MRNNGKIGRQIVFSYVYLTYYSFSIEILGKTFRIWTNITLYCTSSFSIHRPNVVQIHGSSVGVTLERATNGLYVIFLIHTTRELTCSKKTSLKYSVFS